MLHEETDLRFSLYSKSFYMKSSHNHFDRSMPKWGEPEELKIPVSYGHIAAKVWGNENGEPVLALHGWQDNCGTFDKLIPLLTPNLYIVAIDAPGHGLSSHIPLGAFYYSMEAVVFIRRIMSYLNWDKFSFLGHSVGAGFALMYSSIFPEDVKNVVLLDTIKPDGRAIEHLPDATRVAVETLLNLEKKMSGSVPVYTVEEARTRLMKSMVHEITPESADVLLKRGCISSNDGKGVVFSRDIRLKTGEELQKLNGDDLKVFMRKIKCNMLILLGKNSSLYKPKTPDVISVKKISKEAHDFLNIYKENCRSLKVISVDGNHYAHLNNPENVAPHINAFFSEHIGINLPKL